MTQTEPHREAPRGPAPTAGPGAAGPVSSESGPKQHRTGQLATRVAEASATIRRRSAPTVEAVGGAAARVRVVLGYVTSLGWTTVAVAVLCWVLGWQLGWREAFVVGTACLLLVLLCAAMTVGRTRLQVRVDLSPRRVVAGNPAAGRIQVINTSRTKLLPVLLELPIGVSAARFNLPRLHTGMGHEELFTVTTARRGIIEVGPARTVRGDPFGLVRRAVIWTRTMELVVHPITVPIEPLGAGVLRDLEGQTTNETSVSDLAFHTLREYAPGDDRRYIHWRSSAKASAAGPRATLLVRQFLDTRRSHLAVLVDGHVGSYLDPVDFELAISAGASIARRALSDEIETTVFAADQVVHEAAVQLTMDTFSRAELGGDTLPDMARHVAQIAPETTVAVLVTGAQLPITDLRRARAFFPNEVNVVAVRVDPTAPAALAIAGTLTVLTLPELSGLAALLSGSGVAP